MNTRYMTLNTICTELHTVITVVNKTFVFDVPYIIVAKREITQLILLSKKSGLLILILF